MRAGAKGYILKEAVLTGLFRIYMTSLMVGSNVATNLKIGGKNHSMKPIKETRTLKSYQNKSGKCLKRLIKVLIIRKLRLKGLYLPTPFELKSGHL